MTENLTEIFVALLAQEKYRADRELNHTLDELWGGLMGRGVYHSSDNVFQTKQCFESDLENRRETALTSATRVLSGASRRQASDLKPAITQLAIDWLGANIDECQSRLTQHAVKLNLNSPELVDLGRDRLVATLSAELALISEPSAMPLSLAEAFVDAERLDGLAALAPSQLDVSRLIRLCEEVNICFRCQCFHAVAFLTRAVLDHIPPLFGYQTFAEVANNYSVGGKSFKGAASHLDGASRKISDGLIHLPIRGRESLPTLAQVDVRQQLDTVLAEAIRINRGA
ncbi:MAG: hypothetical protein QOJ16_2094 [Acidobacteriota bacterium]|jgi:hypothetical protein|nr:hypothetical protein [Acidobacteriota bacterium]